MRSWLQWSLVAFACGVLSLPVAADLTEKQRAELSKTMLDEIVKVHGPAEPLSREEAVAQVFYSLVEHAERKDVTYRLDIIEEDMINAYAMPNGQVVFFTGLLKALPADDLGPIAFVAAHEISHIEHRHAERKFKNAMTTGLVVGIVARAVAPRTGNWIGLVGGVAHQLVTSGYSREMETEADLRAMELLAKANYDPEAALVVFRLFEETRSGSRAFPTHPLPTDRYKNTIAWLGENNPLSPVAVLSGHECGFCQELETIADSAKRLGKRGQGAERKALAQIEEKARQLEFGISLHSPNTPDNFQALLGARSAWNGPAQEKSAGKELAARLEGLERQYLLWQIRRCEAMAERLWDRAKDLAPEAFPDSQTRQTLLGMAESSRDLRIAIEEGMLDLEPQLQAFSENQTLWSQVNPSFDPDCTKLVAGLGQEIAFVRPAYQVFAGQAPPPPAETRPVVMARESSPTRTSPLPAVSSPPLAASSATGGTSRARVAPSVETPSPPTNQEYTWLPRTDFGDMRSESILKSGAYVKNWETMLVKDLQADLGADLIATADSHRRARSVTYSFEGSRATPNQVVLVYLLDPQVTYGMFAEELRREVTPHLIGQGFHTLGVGVKQNIANKKHVVILLEKTP